MHIGTGQFEGKKLKDTYDGAPLSTRILTIKESIFEVIGVRIHEASVLDINDPNGMYGIEAISKGAAVVQFVNRHHGDRDLLRENLEIVGLEPDDFILAMNLKDFFDKGTDVHFDIIFFRAADKDCLNLLNRVLSLQNSNGITVVFYPNDGECSMVNPPTGYDIIDSREAELEKVAVLIKKK